MEFNSLIFPAPECSYTEEDFKGELLWLPNTSNTERPAIPCLFLHSNEGSSKVLVYFHGNAEDIGIAYEMLDILRTYLKVHVLGVEYPGYGQYAGSPSAEQILEDASSVYDFLVEMLGIDPSNLLIFGRSIGSGPSTFLGSEKPVGAVLLMSPFTSIRDATRDIAGRFAQYFVADRFRNIDNVQNFTCPTFIVHGEIDELIPYSHALALRDNCAGPVHLELSKEMDHNFFDYYDDLLLPLTTFFVNFGVHVEPQGTVEIPPGFFTPPPGQPKAQNRGNVHKLLSSIKH